MSIMVDSNCENNSLQSSQAPSFPVRAMQKVYSVAKAFFFFALAGIFLPLYFISPRTYTNLTGYFGRAEIKKTKKPETSPVPKPPLPISAPVEQKIYAPKPVVTPQPTPQAKEEEGDVKESPTSFAYGWRLSFEERTLISAAAAYLLTWAITSYFNYEPTSVLSSCTPVCTGIGGDDTFCFGCE